MGPCQYKRQCSFLTRVNRGFQPERPTSELVGSTCKLCSLLKIIQVLIMSGREILLLLIASLGFYNSQAQIFISDDDVPGIIWAPLPDPRDDTNIMDATFTLITLPPRTRVTDIGMDPDEKMVYWCEFAANKIGRIQIDGTNQEDIISTNSPSNIALDLVNRKIYWTMYNHASIARANLNGTEVETIYTYSGFVQPVGILVDPVKKYLLWSTRIVNQVMRAGLDGTNGEIVAEFYPEAMITEQCADSTTRLFYYTMAGTLGIFNLDGSDDETLTVLANRGYGTTLNKYGGKLIWKVQTQSDNSIYEYNLRTSMVMMHNTTVTMMTDSQMTVNPSSIRIFADVTYDEPVAIEGCPDSFTLNLDEGSTSTPVSWPEPKLNSWSSCPSMEFRGNISNGGNHSAGAYDMSYMASDTAGNTDICQFTVTVLEFGVTEPPTERLTSTQPPPVTLSRCHRGSSGSGTTVFSSTTILGTLAIALIFAVGLL